MKKQLEINDEGVISKIFLIRNKKVMLDEDLAEMYGVETKRLNEQVKRNPERFPEDFMFQLTEEEVELLKSQFATSSWGGRRKLPYAFTEHVNFVAPGSEKVCCPGNDVTTIGCLLSSIS